MYSNIYTSEVKSSWLHACNILRYIHKIISIPVITVIEDK